MKKIFSFILPVAFFAAQLSATNIQGVTPGKLSALLPDNPADVTTLTVSGAVDAADLYYIAKACTSLTSLDLSGATIAAYDGVAVGGRTQHPEATVPSMVFAGSALQSVVFPAAQAVNIAEGAFASSALQSVVLANVNEVGDGAFADCRQLTSATIANATFGKSVFADCPALATVTLSGLQATGASMFARDAALATVAGSASLENIGEASFMGCSALHAFTFGNNLETIGADAFALTGLETAQLSQCSKLSQIGDWAFARDAQLVSVSLPENLSNIGTGAFFECAALAEYATPSSVNTISDFTHTGNTSLDVTSLIPEGVTTIKPYALANLTHVVSLTIPASVEYIGDNAMQNMTSLKSIDAQNLAAAPALGENVWEGVDQGTVNLLVHKKAYDDFVAAPQWCDFNISKTSDVDGIVAPTVGTDTGVQARFLDKLLQIRSIGGSPIATVALYDISGRKLIDSKVGEDFVQIETSGHTGNFFVAYVTLADGKTAAIKLARK